MTTAAVCALAGLATLGLAGTCAAHYGSGFKAAPAVVREGASAGANGLRVRAEGQLRVRLAGSGGGLFSFIEGLFGPGPQSAPRRSREPQYRPSPQSVPRSAPRQE